MTILCWWGRKTLLNQPSFEHTDHWWTYEECVNMMGESWSSSLFLSDVGENKLNIENQQCGVVGVSVVVVGVDDKQGSTDADEAQCRQVNVLFWCVD